jgi:membrane-associated phospholipid phosphatase
MQCKAIQLLFIFYMWLPAVAQDTTICISGHLLQKPDSSLKKWGFVTNVPADLLQIAKSPFKKNNLPGLAVVAASTALLMPFDQKILDGVERISEHLHLQPQTDYKVLLQVGDTRILKLPKNINTALYQIGEGGTSMLVSGGLYIYGKISKDYRALQTASDLAETFITMGITTQVLKRISGRESPFVRTQPGGAWHPFPSLKEFQQNTPSYDAFPSGHLATMMATVTVLTTNYPEKKWIGILGYSLIGLSGWAMINTEVHWIADYPLALALGYISGKITCLRHKRKASTLAVL